jgi:RimJ/RimL family protein N-acetyltransferase
MKEGVPQDEQPLINIRGEGVALGPLRRDLVPTYQRWDTDFATNRTTAIARPVTLEQEAAGYDRAAMSDQDVFFTIYDLASWRPIGKTYLESIDPRNRTAEFGIVVGEEEYRGKGFGTEATRLVLDYAFTVLGLHNVMLVVYEFNLAGRRAYEKAGFREFGRRRQAHLMGGRGWDVIYMECLASDFISSVLGPIFVPDQPRCERGEG